MRPCTALALVLAGAPVPGLPGQDALDPVRHLLDDGDRDEAREVAARYLCATPESPALALRAWAAAGDWRRQALLLRVLGTRGELRGEDAAAGFASPQWPVRHAAARAAAQSTAVDGLAAGLRKLTSDPWSSVRTEALVALHLRGELDPGDLRGALADPGLQPTIFAIWAGAPRALGALLPDLLAVPALRGPVLRRLAGIDVAPARDLLRGLAARPDRPAEERGWALLALPRADWPVDPVVLVLEACDRGGSPESVDRIADILLPAERARFLEGLDRIADEERLRVRLRLAARAPKGAGGALLGALDHLPPAVLGDALALLVRLDTPELEARARAVLAGDAAAETVLPWIQQVGQRLATSPAGRAVLEARLAGGEPVATAAYRALVSARAVGDGVLAFALREAELAPARVGLLLSCASDTPAGFWLPLLRHEDSRLRWAAARGLLAHASEPRVYGALLKALYAETVPQPRGALLAAVLKAVEGNAAQGVVAWVVERSDEDLDRTLLAHLEVGRQPWIDRVLASLAGTRLAVLAVQIRAIRGDAAACREVLARPESVASARLPRLRRSMAAVITASDLPCLAGLLRGDADRAPALPWVREEVIGWLRLRPELDAVDLLEGLLADDEELEVREAAAGALAEHGRMRLPLTILDGWLAEEDGDLEGLLLEVLAAMPARLETDQARFVVRVLVAPALKDPLANVRLEARHRIYDSRVEGAHPILRPAIDVAGRIAPPLFRELLVAELRSRETAWACASKAYLLRMLQLAARDPRTSIVLEPILDWALRLSPPDPALDGGLHVMAAAVRQRGGQPGEAARLLRRGMAELALGGVAERAIEGMARDLAPGSSGPGWCVLEATACLLEAAAASAAGDGPRAAVALDHATLAAREDPTLAAAVTAAREQSGLRPASRSAPDKR